jgi:hypothetical protein
MKGLRDDVTKGIQFGTKRNSGSFKRGRNILVNSVYVMKLPNVVILVILACTQKSDMETMQQLYESATHRNCKCYSRKLSTIHEGICVQNTD